MQKRAKKIILRLTGEQIDTLKSLETHPPFLMEVQNFRKKFLIDTSKGTFGNPEDPYLDFKKISEKFGLPYNLVRSQIFIYIKYNQWSFDHRFPKKFLEYSIETPVNYKIIPDQPAKFDKNGKIIQYSKTISLVTYSVLSTKEQRQAFKDLKDTQKLLLDPKFTKSSRKKRNIEKDIKIENEMSERQPKHTEEKYSGYVEIMKKKHDVGLISTSKFEELKSLNFRDVTEVKIGKSSSDVAVKVLYSRKRANTVRQVNSRFKRKKEEKFGT